MTLDPFLSLPGQKQRTQAKKIWLSGHRTSQRRKPLGPSWAIGGVLFRRKAEITIISEADAAAGPRGKTRFFPDLFPASRRSPRRCQVNTTNFFCGTGPGLHPGPYRRWPASAGATRLATHTAFSEFWVRCHAAVRTPDQRDAGPVPLFARVDTTNLRSVAQRGSAVWPSRHGITR